MGMRGTVIANAFRLAPTFAPLMVRRALRLGGVAVLLLAGTASAQPTAEPPPSRAQELFERGRALLDENQVTEACAVLAESERLEPTVGTLGLLAACHERQGKLATAHREYQATADRATASGDHRADFARTRARELAARVPRLLVTVQDAPPGLVILRDGVAIPTADLGKDILLDPGPVEIVARAPARLDLVIRVVARESTQTVVPIALRGSVAASSDVSSSSAPSRRAPRSPEPGPRSSGIGARLPIALAAGGFGAAALAVAGAFGGSAFGKNEASERIHETCAGGSQACAQGRALREEAQREATVSTGAFVAGVIAVGAGAVVLLTAPSAPATAARSTRRGAFVAVRSTGAGAGVQF